MKAPGKILFTYLEAGTSFKCYLSYSDSRPKPNCKRNDGEIFIGYVPKHPRSLDIKSKALGPNFIFEHPIVYLAFYADKDTNVVVNLRTKLEKETHKKV
jgi:hypothetical protein